MPRIRCHFTDCVFLDEGYCSAAAIELEVETGCATYSPSDVALAEDDWDDDEVDDWDDDPVDDSDDDLWLDEDDEF